ncbi:MAG: twin transmembrane helix small protein [Pseudomonadota bacterium]
MKILVILLLFLAIGSLASGLFFLMQDKGQSGRTAKALTWRIGISITAFLLVMIGAYFGFIPIHGVQP